MFGSLRTWIWSHSPSVMFLKLDESQQSHVTGIADDLPFVAQDSSIVNQNAEAAERVEGGLDDGCAVGDRVVIDHGLPARCVTPS